MRMKPLTKAFIWIAAIASLLGLYFASNIKGYYRFKEICEKEGGLKVYQSLVKGEGWQLLDSTETSSAKYLLHVYDGIGFVRYRTAKGDEFDVTRQSQQRDSFGNLIYLESPSELALSPKYTYVEQRLIVEDSERIQRYRTSISDFSTKKILVDYQDFVYQPFSVQWGYGGGIACSLQDKPSDQQPNRTREDQISKAFGLK
jgi:hypothetical protein